jgi:hypothetical protein
MAADPIRWVQNITGWAVADIWNVMSRFQVDDAAIVYDGCGTHDCVLVWDIEEGDDERSYRQAG